MQLDWSKVPYISDAKMRIFRQQIFSVHTEPDANTRIKLAKLIEFGAVSFAPKSTTFSTVHVLVMVELKKKKNRRLWVHPLLLFREVLQPLN